MKPNDLPPTSIVNLMTIDVEDYFQVGAFAERIPRDTWDTFPCRVERNVEVILELDGDRFWKLLKAATG